MLAHYEFSPALELFVEAKWARVNALGNNAGPSFIQGTFGTGDYRERTRLDNPFLNPADRTTIANLILASGCNTSLTAACPAAWQPHVAERHGTGGPLNATDIAAIAAGTYRFVDSRNLLDVGLRDEHFQRDTWRVVAGLRGTFNADWSYEISANYGKFKEDVTTDGFIDRQRFVLAHGCRPQSGHRADPVPLAIRSGCGDAAAAPAPSAGALAAQNAARLAADIAACVPYNPFGTPDNSGLGRLFRRVSSPRMPSSTQLVLSGFVSGDISQLFELPGGPVSFALGAEYRRENAFYSRTSSSRTASPTACPFRASMPNTFTVKEAYGELRIPLLRDMPFFHELTASGAARVARYQGGSGTVWSYNAGLDWAPVRDLRFRGNYSRAVRAPNVSETAFPLVPNFAPGFQDPCDPNNIGAGSPNASANCQAAAFRRTSLALITPVTYSLPIVSGSNPNLTAETSNSWTFGAVIQPRWIPGMSLSVDYYDITVNSIIAAVSAQQIVNNCYDFPISTTCSARCSRVISATATNATGDTAGHVVANSLIWRRSTSPRRIRRGIDINLAYRHPTSGRTCGSTPT